MIAMAKPIWNRCPKHRIDMIRDYDKDLKPFYYCPTCGFYRYHDGIEGYNNKLINYENVNSKNIDEVGILCPQCQGNYLDSFEGKGLYCSRCKYRS